MAKKGARKTKAGTIGCFADLVFITSDTVVLTPRNIKQKVSAQWNKHSVIGRKPRSEFGGADLRSVTFTIVLDASCGVKPRKTLKRIERLIEKGYVDYLVIGNKAIGKHRFKITSMSETWDVIYNRGELAKATLDISLEEYI